MYNNLKTELEKKKIEIIKVALVTNLDREVLMNKLNGKKCFTIMEAQIIRDTFFPECSIDYLFQTTENQELKAL